MSSIHCFFEDLVVFPDHNAQHDVLFQTIVSQSAATSEIVKALLATSSSHVGIATYSK